MLMLTWPGFQVSISQVLDQVMTLTLWLAPSLRSCLPVDDHVTVVMVERGHLHGNLSTCAQSTSSLIPAA